MTTNERKTISLLSLSHFFCHVAILTFPAILILLKEKFHVSFATLGIIAGIYLFLFGAGSLPVGFIADKINKNFLLKVYLIGMSLSAFLAALSGNFYIFAIFIILMGLIGSIYHPVGLSIMSFVKTDKLRGFAIHGIAGTLGVALSAAFAGFLGYYFGYNAPYLVLGLIFLSIFVYSFFIKIESNKIENIRNKNNTINNINRNNNSSNNININKINSSSNNNYENYLESKNVNLLTNIKSFFNDFFHRNIVFIFIVEFLNGFVFQGVFSFLPAYTGLELKNFLFFHNQTVAAGSFYVTVALLVGVLFQYSSTYITKRYKPNRVFSVLVLISGIFILISGFTGGLILFLSILLFAAFDFSINPISNLLISRNAKEYYRSTAYGIFFFAGFGIGSIAAPIGGFIASSFKLSDTFVFYGIIALISFVISIAVTNYNVDEDDVIQTN
ncbi:MAG: MFS transporter [bacterium]